MASAAVFRSGTFAFEVGPDKECFVIHKKAIEDHSPVLSTLMNNGHMIESTTETAHLDDTSPQTFGLFAEYIYTGIYRVEVSTSPSAGSVSQNVQQRSFRVKCLNCGPSTANGYLLGAPDECSDCGTSAVDVENIEDGSMIRMGMDVFDRSPYQKRYGTSSTSSIQPDDSVSDKLRNLSYLAIDRSHTLLKDQLAKLSPKDQVVEKVSAHALLYVFGQKYMVESLQALCLHKLHRNLLEFKIGSNNIHDIIELLQYTYENTSNADSGVDDCIMDEAPASVCDDSSASAIGHTAPMSNKKKVTREKACSAPLSEDPEKRDEQSTMQTTKQAIGGDLRTLVMMYAVANSKKLLEFPEFHVMLQQGGEIFSDFITGITKRLPEKM